MFKKLIIKKLNFMKTYLVAIVALLVATSCTNSAKNKIDGTDSQAVANGSGQELVVDTLASEIHWIGSKPGGNHNGTLGIKSGTLTINDNKLVAGTFVLDMNKIIDKDLTDAASNAQLVGHLKSADFFDVAQYPEGKFEITKVEELTNDSVSHRISGNLTLKNTDKNITFDAKITKEGDTYKAVSVPFTIDRTQWGVNYGSKNIFKDLKDAVINDNIELQITIIAKNK